MMELQYLVVGEYLVAIVNRRLHFSNYDERRLAASRMEDEAGKIQRLFSDLVSGTDIQFTYLHEVLPTVAGVIELCDKSLLSLEATSLLRKFPDMHSELVTSLLMCREDVGRSDAKSLADDCVNHTKLHPKDPVYLRLFQRCQSEGTRSRLPGLEETMQSMFSNIINKNSSNA